jgi:hypothetical protein
LHHSLEIGVSLNVWDFLFILLVYGDSCVVEGRGTVAREMDVIDIDGVGCGFARLATQIEGIPKGNCFMETSNGVLDSCVSWTTTTQVGEVNTSERRQPSITCQNIHH